MLKAIIFDFDGVVVDSEPLHYHATMRVFEPMGLSLTYEGYLADMVGFDDRDLLRCCLSRVSAPPPSDDELRNLIDVKADAFEQIVEQGVEAVPGVIDFVRNKSADVPKVIASGASRRDIELILKVLKLDDCFEGMVTADDVVRSKPDPQTYGDAVKMLGARFPEMEITPSQCVAIEDTAAGLESARGAGLHTVGLTTTGPAAMLHRAHRIAANFESLTMDLLHDWFDEEI